LTASAAAGWRFDRWEGDLTGGAYDHWRGVDVAPARPANLIMDADKSIRAIFVTRQTDPEVFQLGDNVTLSVITIPGGTFTMGSPEEERERFGGPGVDFSDESPQRTVTVSTFAMGETEVTQAQFEVLMGYVPNIPSDCESDCIEIALGDDLPVAWVNWEEAVAFCDALSDVTGRLCRLPTEAEWEYACRAGSGTAFSFGDTEDLLDDNAWWSGNSGWPEAGVTPKEVAAKLPNAFGLYDMHGNVWEWVGDWASASYAPDDATDPTGPAVTGMFNSKVLRGGSYNRLPWAVRSAYRYDQSPQAQFNFGFRVVCE
jgi:formylglycine-generating enzyme required for sulfatase activity